MPKKIRHPKKSYPITTPLPTLPTAPPTQPVQPAQDHDLLRHIASVLQTLAKELLRLADTNR
jgi:hypothetical protein